jgi:pilus assembly protein CpaC
MYTTQPTYKRFKPKNIVTAALCTLWIAADVTTGALALADNKDPKSAESAVVQVPVNGSASIRLSGNISRVAIGSETMATVATIGNDELLVTGKRIGTTTLMIWRDGKLETRIVVVGYPQERILSVLKSSLRGAKDLSIEAAGAALVLSGNVTSAADVERADQILRGFLPAGVQGADAAPSIVNLLRVVGDQQVQIEVSFAEVSRSGLRQMGMNLWSRNLKNNWVGGLLSPSTSLATGTVNTVPAGDPTAVETITAPLTSAFTGIFGLGNDYRFPFSAALSILANHGYSRTLAEPTLTALSGQKAVFLAGGEFPLPLPQALGQVTVEFKKFGVELEFLPTVMDDTIQLAVDMSVSDLDFSLGIKLSNVTVPGLTKRHSSSVVRLRDGQSFAIAGLLSDKVRSSVDKVPWLGDLPVLGALFRSTRYQRDESELIVVVTARLARPQGEKPILPGEGITTDPSDLEIFLLGSQESKLTEDVKATRAKNPAGPVGFRR